MNIQPDKEEIISSILKQAEISPKELQDRINLVTLISKIIVNKVIRDKENQANTTSLNPAQNILQDK